MKGLLAGIVLACASLAPGAAAVAQSDGGIVKLIVPYVPGGFPDTVSRIVAGQMTSEGKQTFVVENRPGGAGVIAADLVAKSAPDGRTLLVADPQQWGVARHLVKNLSFDVERDFKPVGAMAATGNYLMTSAGVEASTFKDLVALIRAKPNALNYGTPGVGSIHHLMFEAFLQRIGGKATQVPFKGGGEVAVALVNGQVQLAVQAMPAVAARVKEGKIKVFGVVLAKRSPFTPDVPTLEELGVPNMDFPAQLGLLAPAQTPGETVERLAAAMKAAVHAPSVVERLRVLAVAPVGSGPQELAATIRADIAKFGDAARAAGLKPE
jgi:tripartite-type tricarboxylate transporter receptor subunit TctC